MNFEASAGKEQRRKSLLIEERKESERRKRWRRRGEGEFRGERRKESKLNGNSPAVRGFAWQMGN